MANKMNEVLEQSKHALTLFGGSGDLSFRKLLPALYNLEVLGKLEEGFTLVAVGRRPYATEEYLEIARDWIREYARIQFDETVFARFSSRVHYFKMDISQENEYKRLQEFYDARGIVRHFYYYAVAPSYFLPITVGLSKHCSSNAAQVIVEKPFGEDLVTATKLYYVLETFFGAENIYHIDHYLGKEMIQNILSIRFQNTIFRGIWNKDFIDNIQITASEKVGVGTRAGYYDKSGALKDMVQNHLFQVLSLVALEDDERSLAERQLELLRSIRPVEDVSSQLVMAQYAGYLEEEGIAEDSRTETYVALKLFIDQERWEGVPFYIRTGKMLKQQETMVTITFKAQEGERANLLVLKIQPDEGVQFYFNAKKPGTEQELQTVVMDFCQSCVLENRMNTPEAYERLLDACFQQDRSLFSRWEQIVASWEFIYDLHQKYREASMPLATYMPGTMGPTEADALVHWFEEESVNENF